MTTKLVKKFLNIFNRDFVLDRPIWFSYNLYKLSVLLLIYARIGVAHISDLLKLFSSSLQSVYYSQKRKVKCSSVVT